MLVYVIADVLNTFSFTISINCGEVLRVSDGLDITFAIIGGHSSALRPESAHFVCLFLRQEFIK